MLDSTSVFAVRRVIFSAFIIAFSLFQIFPPEPLLAGVYPDPTCEQECDDRYISCMYEDCDQRGDCSYCGENQDWCISNCPLVCEEPKSIRDYTKTVYFNVQLHYVTACLRNGPSSKEHNRFTYQARVDTYRETTHCDGTKTTTLLSTGSPSGILVCWGALSPIKYCSSNNYAPICPFTSP